MSATIGVKLLTVEDLMERWGVSRTVVLQHVDNPDNPLPVVPLSTEQRGQRKNRCLLRFRLAAIEAWEVGSERRTARPVDEPAPPPGGMPAGFSGKIHTRTAGKVAAKKGAGK